MSFQTRSELYNGTELLKSENMDFQTHLYRYGEMEEYLEDVRHVF